MEPDSSPQTSPLQDPLRVSYVTMRFPGTSETFATNDVRTLHAWGVDIRVHGLKSPNPRARALAEERGVQDVPMTHGGVDAALRGIRVGVSRPLLLVHLLGAILAGCWRRPEHLLKSLLLAPRALDVFASIEAERPDVVHVYWGHYPSLVGWLVQRRLPHVVCSISLAAYDLEMRYGVTHAVARRADFVRTLGRVNVDEIHEVFGVPRESIRVIYDGVDLARFPTEAEALPKIGRRIVTAGRLIRSKGIDDALHVFQRVLTSFPDATLVVLGDGPERANLEQLARELGVDHATTFLGHVEHERVFEEMARAEVFLFMSKKSSERLPNVVKEGMAWRCACVATDTPGIDELLIDGETGWVVRMGDVETAAARVHEAFETNGGRRVEAMTARAYGRLCRAFGLDVAMRAYLRAWRDAVEARTAARSGAGGP